MKDTDAVRLLKYGTLAFVIMLPLFLLNYWLFSRAAMDSFLMNPMGAIALFLSLTVAIPFILDYNNVKYLPAIHGLIRWGIVMVAVAIPYWDIIKISTLMFVELGIMMFGYIASDAILSRWA